MTKEEFLAAWQRTAADDAPALEQLYTTYNAANRQAIESLAALAGQKDGLGPTAAATLALLEEAAWPVLEQVNDYPRLARFGRLVTGLEARTTAYLRRALTDFRTVPLPPYHERIEVPVPVTRIADEAYLALRRLTGGESELDAQMEADLFLAQPNPQRNAEIESYQRTGVFTRLLPPADE
jgi:hypothetical protein